MFSMCAPAGVAAEGSGSRTRTAGKAPVQLYQKASALTRLSENEAQPATVLKMNMWRSGVEQHSQLNRVSQQRHASDVANPSLDEALESIVYFDPDDPRYGHRTVGMSMERWLDIMSDWQGSGLPPPIGMLLTEGHDAAANDEGDRESSGHAQRVALGMERLLGMMSDFHVAELDKFLEQQPVLQKSSEDAEAGAEPPQGPRSPELVALGLERWLGMMADWQMASLSGSFPKDEVAAAGTTSQEAKYFQSDMDDVNDVPPTCDGTAIEALTDDTGALLTEIRRVSSDDSEFHEQWI